MYGQSNSQFTAYGTFLDPSNIISSDSKLIVTDYVTKHILIGCYSLVFSLSSISHFCSSTGTKL